MYIKYLLYTNNLLVIITLLVYRNYLTLEVMVYLHKYHFTVYNNSN